MIDVQEYIAKYQKLPRENDPDYLDWLARKKMTVFILNEPNLMPHKCAKCSSTKIGDRKYVDFGLTTEWFGTVFLCTLCLKEIFDAVFPPEVSEDKNEDTGIDTVIVVNMLEKIKVDVEDALGKVRGLNDIPSHFSVLNASVERSFVDPPPEKSSKQKSHRAKPRAAESTTESGRSNLLSFTELMEQSKSDS